MICNIIGQLNTLSLNKEVNLPVSTHHGVTKWSTAGDSFLYYLTSCDRFFIFLSFSPFWLIRLRCGSLFWFGPFSQAGFHETVFHGEVTVVKDRLRRSDEQEVARWLFLTVGAALIAPLCVWDTVMCTSYPSFPEDLLGVDASVIRYPRLNLVIISFY